MDELSVMTVHDRLAGSLQMSDDEWGTFFGWNLKC